MNKLKQINVVITCVEYNDKKIITKIGYSTTMIDESNVIKTETITSGFKESFISTTRKKEKDNLITASIKTSKGNTVEIIEEKNGSKYLRTKGNTCTTDDLGDLESCSKK